MSGPPDDGDGPAPPGADGSGGPAPDADVVDLDGTAALALTGTLDAAAGTDLCTALARLIAGGTTRVDLDLRDVTGFDEDGVAALAACHALAPQLADGLHYRTGPGPGRDALLASYAADAAAG